VNFLDGKSHAVVQLVSGDSVLLSRLLVNITTFLVSLVTVTAEICKVGWLSIA